MLQPLGKKIIVYSSAFITLAVSLPKILIWQRNDIVARLIPFNGVEWSIQLFINFLFCILIFLVNKKHFSLFSSKTKLLEHGRLAGINILLMGITSVTGGFISRMFFKSEEFPLNGYLVRLLVILLLILIEIKVLATLSYAQQKENENELLRHSNTVMELELLKSQLNPHFFFNALSSLAGITRENPLKAQEYIAHLSKIFRYSINKPGQTLVYLKDELTELYSYAELMKMRHEESFNLYIRIDEQYNSSKLPHLSLQPLLENAFKHNNASPENPLNVFITARGNVLLIENNLQEKNGLEPHSGIGLANLNNRYKIIMQQEIEIEKTVANFTVKLPLL